MKHSAHFSSNAPVIHGEVKPSQGWVVGYTAIIEKLHLPIPVPSIKTMISEKNQRAETETWIVFPNKYLPEDNIKISKIEALYNHLVFALKYEGVNLLVFAKLNEVLSSKEIFTLVNIEPSGQYSRRIWFLLEWISGSKIKGKNDLTKKSYVSVIDEKLQYAVSGVKSSRHLVINNLAGTNKFCPLIKKSKKLEDHITKNYIEVSRKQIAGIRKDIIQRASAFLLLKDSKASFTIEGESPKSKRAARWGAAIGQAGLNDLTKEELIRLQSLVIENSRFVQMGFRTQGGFVGEHDRITGEPIPEHISAKFEDVNELIDGLIESSHLLINDDYNAVLAAAIIAFGFVFIHPFEDGNGRIHRYIIHHMLAKKQFTDQGIIFPVSSSILDHINDYRIVLESYSKPLLDFIEWTETPNHNVNVTNKTKDYYRFFDATKQAEFLFDCVKDTIENIVPQEINYLANYDAFKNYLDDEFEMPDKLVSILVRFLEQNQGQLSKRGKEKEFNMLSEKEVKQIESMYASIFSK
ncbi:MAG: Fic family protein [Bacteroidota bacterium]